MSRAGFLLLRKNAQFTQLLYYGFGSLNVFFWEEWVYTTCILRKHYRDHLVLSCLTVLRLKPCYNSGNIANLYDDLLMPQSQLVVFCNFFCNTKVRETVRAMAGFKHYTTVENILFLFNFSLDCRPLPTHSNSGSNPASTQAAVWMVMRLQLGLWHNTMWWSRIRLQS